MRLEIYKKVIIKNKNKDSKIHLLFTKDSVLITSLVLDNEKETHDKNIQQRTFKDKTLLKTYILVSYETFEFIKMTFDFKEGFHKMVYPKQKDK